MKVSKNKIYAIFLYLFIIFTTYYFIGSIKVIEYQKWLQYMGWYIVFHMMSTFVCLHFAKIKIFTLSGFFLLFTYIFHFGQIIIRAIAPKYRFTIVEYANWLSMQEFKDTIELTLLVVTFVVVGMIITPQKKRVKNRYSKKNLNANYKKMGWYILLISLPFKIMIDVKSMMISLQSGYISMLKMDISGIVYQISYFYIIGVVFLLIAYRKNTKKATTILIITVIYNIISMISGGRARAMINILLLVYIYFKLIKTLEFKQVVKFAVIGYIGILFYNGVTELRAEGTSSMYELLEVIFASKSNPIIKVMEEFGSTIYTVYQAMVFVPNKLDYSFGATYVYSLSQILVNVKGVLNEVTEAATFAKHITSGFPMGGSYIGELYYNFGYFSIVGGVVVGVFVNKISLAIERCIKYEKYYTFSYYIMLFTNIIWWVRSAFSDLTRGFVWGAILIYCMYYLANKRITYLKSNLNI